MQKICVVITDPLGSLNAILTISWLHWWNRMLQYVQQVFNAAFWVNLYQGCLLHIEFYSLWAMFLAILDLVKGRFLGPNNKTPREILPGLDETWTDKERQAMGSKRILWEVIGHKVSIFTRHRDPLHCGCLICYYIFISHENQSVAVINFNCIQSRYVAVDILGSNNSGWFFFFLMM